MNTINPGPIIIWLTAARCSKLIWILSIIIGDVRNCRNIMHIIRVINS